MRSNFMVIPVVFITTFSLVSTTRAEDCVPPHPTIDDLGLLNPEIPLCPVIIKSSNEVVVEQRKGDIVHVAVAVVVDRRTCDDDEITMTYQPTHWDPEPGWQPGDFYWVIVRQPGNVELVPVDQDGKKLEAESDEINVVISGGCSDNITLVRLTDEARWDEAHTKGEIESDFVVLAQSDADPGPYGLPDAAYWKFEHVGYQTWIRHPTEGDLRSMTWAEILSKRKSGP